MATQKVMDHTGHTTHEFDPKDSLSVAKALARFDELTGNGYVAAKSLGDGKHEIMREFDPNAEDTIFHSHLVGG